MISNYFCKLFKGIKYLVTNRKINLLIIIYAVFDCVYTVFRLKQFDKDLLEAGVHVAVEYIRLQFMSSLLLLILAIGILWSSKSSYIIAILASALLLYYDLGRCSYHWENIQILASNQRISCEIVFSELSNWWSANGVQEIPRMVINIIIFPSMLVYMIWLRRYTQNHP